MEQNNFNRLSTYEDVFSNFSQVLEEYLAMTNGEEIRDFNLITRDSKYGKGKNDLIEDDFTPNELVEEIKDSYLRRNYLKGEIGMLNGDEQYDGIFNISLYMLMANRLGKIYKGELDNNSNLDKNTKTIYKEKYRNLMAKKIDAATKLIYSLFIYKETENNNDFYYGWKESRGKTLIIDLPTYGQISVHFGSTKRFNSVIYLARQNINLILEKKLELGQITEKEFNTIKAKTDTDEIFPNYTGIQYDISSGIPLDYHGKKFETAQNDLGLSKTLSTEITDDDIEKMVSNTNYTNRELYYFALKKDFSKSQLEKLRHLLHGRDIDAIKKSENSHKKKRKKKHKKKKTINTESIGEKAVSLTTADERQQVASHEIKLDEKQQDISNEK